MPTDTHPQGRTTSRGPTSAPEADTERGGYAENGDTAKASVFPKESQAQFQNPTDQLWSLYNGEAEKWDSSLATRLRENTEGLLIFAGLFSAAVTAFIIESYQYLLPDAGDASATYLLHISQQLAALGNGSIAQNIPVLPVAFSPSSSAVRANILWVLSLIFSLACALCATLVQTWASRYIRLIHLIPQVDVQAQRRAHLYEGMKQSRVYDWIEFLPALLHVSLFLFFAGLIEFFLPFNQAVGHATLIAVLIVAVAYLVFTVFPYVTWNSPFRTPLSAATWWVLFFGAWLYAMAAKQILNVGSLVFCSEHMGRAGSRYAYRVHNKVLRVNRDWQRPANIQENQFKALRWLVDRTAHIEDMERLLGGIASYLSADKINRDNSKVILRLGAGTLAHPGLGARVGRLLYSCNDAGSLGNDRVQRRIGVCTRVLWHLFTQSTSSQRLEGPYWTQWAPRQTVISLRVLCATPDPIIGLHARCTGLVILHRALGDLGQRMTQGDVTIRAPPDWLLPHIAFNIGRWFMQSYRRGLHEMEVIRLLLPYNFAALQMDARLRAPVRSSKVNDKRIFVDIGSDEVYKPISPDFLINEGGLIGLNELMWFIGASPPIGSDDVKLVRDTLAAICPGWVATGTSKEVQTIFVDLLEQVLQTHSAPDEQGLKSKPPDSLLPDLVRHLGQVADTLDCAEVKMRAQEIMERYGVTGRADPGPVSPDEGTHYGEILSVSVLVPEAEYDRDAMATLEADLGNVSAPVATETPNC